MDSVIFASRIVLAAVFLLSGTSKVFDLAGTGDAAIQFGVPARLSGFVARVLTVLELVLAVCLLVPVTAPAASLAAAALLAVFSVLIGVTLARGRRVECHCFGKISNGTISWTTLARSVALAALAGFLVAGRDATGPVSGWAWLPRASSTALVGVAFAALLVVVVVVLGLLVVQVLRQNGRILLRLDELEGTDHVPLTGTAMPRAPAQMGLPLGVAAPSFTLPGLYGETLTLESARASGLSVLVTFMHAGCGPCNALLPELAGWQRDLRERYSFIIICGGSVEQNRVKVGAHRLTGVALEGDDRAVSSQYQAYGTPAAVLVTADGRIGSLVAAGADAIRQLVRTGTAPKLDPALHEHLPPQHLPREHQHHESALLGKPVPDVRVTTLDGEVVSLAAPRTKRTVLLFWNPSCGFCQQMLGRIMAWEKSASADAPDLVVVSTGDIEVNRAMGLRSPMLLDAGFTAGQALGAHGTPSALLISASGLVHSTLMVGADAVMTLLGERLGNPVTDTEAAVPAVLNGHRLPSEALPH